MSNKLLKSIIEHGTLTDFSALFKEEVDQRIAALKEELRLKIQADFDLYEAADIVGKDTDDESPKSSDKEKGPSDESDADEEEHEKKHKVTETISGMEGPYKSPTGVKYYYDPKEGMYYDPSTDLYVTGDALGIK